MNYEAAELWLYKNLVISTYKTFDSRLGVRTLSRDLDVLNAIGKVFEAFDRFTSFASSFALSAECQVSLPFSLASSLSTGWPCFEM